MVRDKALTFQLCRKIPTKTESSDTSKVFIRRRKSTVRVNRHRDRLRERVPPVWECESRLWSISSGFALALLCRVLSLLFGLSQGPLCVSAHLLAKMDPSEEAYG